MKYGIQLNKKQKNHGMISHSNYFPMDFLAEKKEPEKIHIRNQTKTKITLRSKEKNHANQEKIQKNKTNK
jgi:hypothetical protein